MERLRVGVALVLIVVYVSLTAYDALEPAYEFPPGITVLVGAAVTYLLGGPAIRRISGLRLEMPDEDDEQKPKAPTKKANPKERPPDEP